MRSIGIRSWHKVSWYGFVLVIRLYRSRGWEPVYLERAERPGVSIWQLPDEELHR